MQNLWSVICNAEPKMSNVLCDNWNYALFIDQRLHADVWSMAIAQNLWSTICNAKSTICNAKPMICNLQSAMQNQQSAMQNPWSTIWNAKPMICNLAICNAKSVTCDSLCKFLQKLQDLRKRKI
jgi:hypothetical protein